jgi:hypothetical protein
VTYLPLVNVVGIPGLLLLVCGRHLCGCGDSQTLVLAFATFLNFAIGCSTSVHVPRPKRRISAKHHGAYLTRSDDIDGFQVTAQQSEDHGDPWLFLRHNSSPNPAPLFICNCRHSQTYLVPCSQPRCPAKSTTLRTIDGLYPHKVFHSTTRLSFITFPNSSMARTHTLTSYVSPHPPYPPYRPLRDMYRNIVVEAIMPARLPASAFGPPPCSMSLHIINLC